MTQPETAVGGDDTSVAEPTLEDRFARHMEEPQEEEEEASQEAESDEPAELTPEDVEEDTAEGEEQEDAEPAIPAPVSWTAEEKAEFAKLPKSLQETLTRRETEREKFVQTKAQEAARSRSEAETQALAQVQQLQQSYAQQVKALLPEVPAKPPYTLQAQNPYAFAQAMEAHDNAVAQHQWAQQQLAGISQNQSQIEQQIKAQAAQASMELLQEQFPEYLDEAKRPELQNKLRSTALALGYSDRQLAHTDGQDLIAIRTASDWKAKADKYDSLMAKKMERVREAKALPKVSRPGAPLPKGAVSSERLQADRNAMRDGDRDAAVRVFGRHLK